VSRAAVILFFGVAFARPYEVTEVNLPLRVVVKSGGERMSNCIFSTQPIPAHARFDTLQTSRFEDKDPMFARCYFPDHPGANKPGELIDVFYLDGKKWWTQAYDQSVAADALERPIALGEVLRTMRSMIPKGGHNIEMVGMMVRGKKTVKLYRGRFQYVR